ncbi:TPA: dihydroorotase [Klebsiella pneumoniae]|nr:dihydroorotase [Klebsiella pneumoniae]HBS7022780.1 dihydroorotase [Klebsiella pneumoniae]HDY7177022.1 dihydroorotase [Klebsiella pneumoniae]HDY8546067.1 dihydroorotase [Klebsiella pneumoniae]HED8861190.1 dihydroorotase [Klebsiella pneumoniae]
MNKTPVSAEKNGLLTLRRPDDFHLHLRDGEILKAVLPFTTKQFARAVVMPNLNPPVTTVAAMEAYREIILAAVPQGHDFTPLMTLYLCDDTLPEVIRVGHQKGILTAVKWYPARATTHAEYGVTSVSRIRGCLDILQALGIPLLIHGESTRPDVDIFDRERVFIEDTVMELRCNYPQLKIVLEHITTQDAVRYIQEQEDGLTAATITPQHLLFNRNVLFNGGIRPHYYCLPVLKREYHRQSLLKAATSGDRRFFAGTDSAPHPRTAKLAACGCAGIFNAPSALECYATAFEAAGALPHLQAFVSEYGARFYGLPLNTGTVTLARQPLILPEPLVVTEHVQIDPFPGEVSLNWRLVGNE